ncbi:MAG: hypothetical protein QW324_07915, partial [Thermofilaceae archaeon]
VFTATGFEGLCEGAARALNAWLAADSLLPTGYMLPLTTSSDTAEQQIGSPEELRSERTARRLRRALEELAL